ncbi:phenazine biosynthesis protein PhzF [Dictyobacter alpinus]|uniref:Phenazine biosynthesis protein PhzF n=1 Tax=Dictyobacter alpinus TaxID=2014873 RepID=A0A402BF61_9CHLR|nr:PhzF family phenazine biosynthesis protein [Dictyobacter alpinus]GCE30023.1 phenazine biosynthesis protein PhzF [Dictyobacter alpinus]
MKQLHYSLVDVFTNQPFGGNQLAVFSDARGLTPETMQALAKELNLSESAFVLPAQSAAADYRVRFFTPAIELPMAGHPTIGTAFVLANEGIIPFTEPETTIAFEEGVGVVPVTLSARAGQPDLIRMRQPLPTFGPVFADYEAIAQMLSLDHTLLDTTLPLEVVSCGVPFLFVPLKSLEAIRSIRFRLDVWERVLRDFAAPHVFVFTQEVVHAGSTVHSRMFAPAMGIAEDPATGAASGPLGCYLVRHGQVQPTKVGYSQIVSEQGIELGRPSFVQVKIELDGEHITGVSIGGQCHFMGKGWITLAD